MFTQVVSAHQYFCPEGIMGNVVMLLVLNTSSEVKAHGKNYN